MKAPVYRAGYTRAFPRAGALPCATTLIYLAAFSLRLLVARLVKLMRLSNATSIRPADPPPPLSLLGGGVGGAGGGAGGSVIGPTVLLSTAVPVVVPV